MAAMENSEVIPLDNSLGFEPDALWIISTYQRIQLTREWSDAPVAVISFLFLI